PAQCTYVPPVFPPSCLFLLLRLSSLPRHPHPFPTRRSSDLDELPDEPARRHDAPPAGPNVVERRSDEHVAVTAALVFGDDLGVRSEEHTSELQSRENLVCRLLLEKKKKKATSVFVPLSVKT